jgi:hypothetical protein
MRACPPSHHPLSSSVILKGIPFMSPSNYAFLLRLRNISIFPINLLTGILICVSNSLSHFRSFIFSYSSSYFVSKASTFLENAFLGPRHSYALRLEWRPHSRWRRRLFPRRGSCPALSLHRDPFRPGPLSVD